MRYTTLRVTEQGVVLLALHRERLAAAGAAALRAFERFAAEAEPGVWAVRATAEGIEFEKRVSRMRDGLPARLRPSPYASSPARWFPKPASPGLYAAVRAPGLATLLTSADGEEIFESCCAAVVGWDGERFVCAPCSRPRVESVSELALRRGLDFREAPLMANEPLPLLLLNAVKGACRIELPGRQTVPAIAVEKIERLFVGLTARS